MSRDTGPVITPYDIVCILQEHRRRWIVPMLICAVLAVGYALFRPATWEASQALMVRDEAIGTLNRPGKFQQLDDMKAVQETVLELARSRTVLGAALAEVDSQGEHERIVPSDADIAKLQRQVKISPPKGAEFGKTEVFYLIVEADSRQRAVALAAAICRQLQVRSQEVRDQKAQGLIAELTKTVDLADAALAETTTQLSDVESRVGTDLGDLRILNETNGGESPLRRSINEMELELRQARQAIEANQELLSLLENSKDDPSSLVAAPNRLLESQPALRRLKDGLVDTQLRTAQLSGNMTTAHPLVISANISQQEIVQHVRKELDTAIRGVQVELRLSQERAASLQSELHATRERLARLAAMRAGYANLAAERNHRSDILKNAEQQLAEVRASQAGARAASLITAIDAPVPGDYPVGPRKAAIVLGGLIGGLIVGFGIVFLTVHPVLLDSAAVARQATVSASKNGHGFNGDLKTTANGANGQGTLKNALGKLAGSW